MNYGNPRPREIVWHEDREQFFKGCWYLWNWNRVFCNDGVVRGRAKFNEHFDRYAFYDADGRIFDHAWLAFVANPDERPRTANALIDIEWLLEREIEAASKREAEIADLQVQLNRLRTAVRRGRYLL